MNLRKSILKELSFAKHGLQKAPNHCRIACKGQAALEFIFIILLIVVYIFTVTMPLVNSAQGAITDIDTITRANNETQKIFDSVKRVSLQGTGSKETINLFIPENAYVGCYEDGNIGFKALINQQISDEESVNPQTDLCENNLCDKNFPMLQGINIECGFAELLSGTRKIIVAKETGKVTIRG